MTTQITLPPNDRAVGNPNPPGDMNLVSTALTAMQATLWVYASGDETGTTDTANINAALAALPDSGGTVWLAPGTFYINGVDVFGPDQGMIGAGSAYTLIEYVGSGTAIQAYESDFDSSSNGGRFGGFYLTGYNSTGDANGFSWGNLQAARCNDITIAGFAAGSGLLLENGYGAWSEQAEWTAIKLVENLNNVTFDNGSFDYSVYQFLIVALANQNGVLLQNAAGLQGCRLEVRGDFYAGETNTGAVIAIDPGSGGAGTSHIDNVQAYVVCETAGSGTGHYTLLMDGSSSGQGFSGAGIMAFTDVTEEFQGYSNPNGAPLAFSGFFNDPVLGGMVLGDCMVIEGGMQYKSTGTDASGLSSGDVNMQKASILTFQLASGNTDITFVNAGPRARREDLIIVQPATGAPGTITWPADVQWAGGSPPVLSTANGAVDWVRVMFTPPQNIFYGELVGSTFQESGGAAVGKYLCPPTAYAPSAATSLTTASATMAAITGAASTVAAGSNGGEISTIATWTSPSAGVLDVANGTLFPSAGGAVTVAASGSTTAIVTYTGTTATSLTGCAYVSGSATGTVATGGAVTLTSSVATTGSFTAPASGSVLVTVSNLVSNLNAAGSKTWFGLAAHNEITPIVGNLVAFTDDTTGCSRTYSFSFLVTSLTAGTAYNYDLLFGVSQTTSTTLTVIAWGQSTTTPSSSSNGAPLTMTVQAA